MLLPQLLRLAESPVMVDDDLFRPPLINPRDAHVAQPNQRGPRPDLSYEADPCRRCRGAVACDRHLIHGHACASSKGKIGTRHNFVRDTRFAMLKESFSEEVGDLDRETRTCRTRDQCRADVMWKDRANYSRQIHYFTDDTGGHPLSPKHWVKEKGSLIGTHTLDTLVKDKEKLYVIKLAPLRLSPAVMSGAVHVIYWTCAFNSLGDLHSDFQKFIRAAVYFRKRKAESEAALTVRADGLSPNQVAVRMKRLFLMRLQWSIARGNARIAGAVGL